MLLTKHSSYSFSVRWIEGLKIDMETAVANDNAVLPAGTENATPEKLGFGIASEFPYVSDALQALIEALMERPGLLGDEDAVTAPPVEETFVSDGPVALGGTEEEAPGGGTVEGPTGPAGMATASTELPGMSGATPDHAPLDVPGASLTILPAAITSNDAFVSVFNAFVAQMLPPAPPSPPESFVPADPPADDVSGSEQAIGMTAGSDAFEFTPSDNREPSMQDTLESLTDAELVAAMADHEIRPDHVPMEAAPSGEPPFDMLELLPGMEDGSFF